MENGRYRESFRVSSKRRPRQASHHRSQTAPQSFANSRYLPTVPTLRFPPHIRIADGDGWSGPSNPEGADGTFRHFDHDALCAPDTRAQAGGGAETGAVQPRPSVWSL